MVDMRRPGFAAGEPFGVGIVVAIVTRPAGSAPPPPAGGPRRLPLSVSAAAGPHRGETDALRRRRRPTRPI